MHSRLSGKLAALRRELDCGEFILADAKDADMAWGASAPGGERLDAEGMSRRRTMPEFREAIRSIVEQEAVDIMLASTATMSVLAHEERLFASSTVTPAVRINDASDVWLPRGGAYHLEPSRPFHTSLIHEVQHGAGGRPGSPPVVNLGLYSVTFNNRLDADLRTLESFCEFREHATRSGFRYILEVFAPNVPGVVPTDQTAAFVNDHICRMLAGVPRDAQPEFLKIPYFGPAALDELVAYEPTRIVGILGGARGTTHDAFQLLAEARRYGARVALFGRKIKDAEEPLSFVEHLRGVADGQLEPREAVKSYHAALIAKGLSPWRDLENDLELTDSTAPGAASYATPRTVSRSG